jgi:hypothetical protein
MTGRYVVRGGEQTFAPPFLQRGTRLRAWALRADPAALQATCDRLLNEPAGGAVSYRALGDHVLFAHAPIASTQATKPPDHDKGFTPETDVAFWMLVGAGTENHGQWELDRIAWLLPYVWVDVPTTMATGREVYGYPKELGWLTSPAGDGDPLVIGLETLVLPTFTPDTELVRRPILRVDRGSDEPAEPSHWSHPGQALDAVRAVMGEVSLGFLEHLLAMLLRAELPMVFLKQIRDVVDPTHACYQAIIESPARIVGMPLGWPLLASYSVTIHDYASHPIARDLGLGAPVNGVLTVTPSIAFEVHFDFLVELGRVIWQA